MAEDEEVTDVAEIKRITHWIDGKPYGAPPDVTG